MTNSMRMGGTNMPARLSLTKAQRDALLTLPDTEEAFVRHYSFSGEDVEILCRYRTPETRLAFALQLCVLRYGKKLDADIRAAGTVTGDRKNVALIVLGRR